MRLIMTTTPRFFKEPSQSFFLLGPRGTGKTWWAQRRFPDALRLDLLDALTFQTLAAHPERLREMIAARPDVQNVIIDEVQKLPGLLDEIHILIEQKRKIRFVLTGSSARKLRRAGTNLLGGRALRRTLHPYMAAELGARFDLQSALETGLVPIIRASDAPRDTLASYNALYLREEVQMERLARNIGAFSRFTEALSFSHGAVLNLAGVSRECEVSRSTAAAFLEIWEDLLLGFRLPVFSRRARRELAVHAKFYFFDTGVFRANRPSGPLDRADEIEGAALEGLVAQHLRAWCDYSGGNHTLHYWQTRSQLELDFVVYGASGLFALEVKNTRRFRPEDLSALYAFGEDYPEARRILLYRGKDRFLHKGIMVVPCEEFLRALVPDTLPFADAKG
jgi:predicted AAA+ superfamily ATPase